MQRKHDDIIATGGYVDVEGLSIIRFNLVDSHYKIFQILHDSYRCHPTMKS